MALNRFDEAAQLLEPLERKGFAIDLCNTICSVEALRQRDGLGSQLHMRLAPFTLSISGAVVLFSASLAACFCSFSPQLII